MRRKKLIFGLICVLTLFFVFSFFFVEKNLSHECHHSVDCEICEQVLVCEKKLNEVLLDSLTNNNLEAPQLISETNDAIISDEQFITKTLISLNVELLD